MSVSAMHIFLEDAISSFRSHKRLAERALEQVSDAEFFIQIDKESNSIAIIIKHISGNLHSRWRDFLTTDGEKPNRNRDVEFELVGDTRESLMKSWEAGWQTLFDALEPLTPEVLEKTVTIRGEPHRVIEAINRQLTHYSYHIGQIVFLAKHFKAGEWKTLSVPRNRSAEFNRFLAYEQKSGHAKKADRLDTARTFALDIERGEADG